jgi:choline dehydrogenase-like flavoprotein
MRGFPPRGCAQVVCAGHGFMRHRRDGFDRLGEPSGDPRLPQTPRLARAWDDLTQILAAAARSLFTAYDDAHRSTQGF